MTVYAYDCDVVEVGTTFSCRSDMIKAGLHNHLIRGFARDPSTNTFSIVLNGGYEDNIDAGDVIAVAGQGKGVSMRTKQQMRMLKRNRHRDYSGRQVGHQEWSGLNRMLAQTKNPVRVIRGSNGNRKYSPKGGYRYDGLYRLESTHLVKGISGFRVYMFILRRCYTDEIPLPTHSYPAQRWKALSPIPYRQQSSRNLVACSGRTSLENTSTPTTPRPRVIIPHATEAHTRASRARKPLSVYQALTFRADIRKMPPIPKIRQESQDKENAFT